MSRKFPIVIAGTNCLSGVTTWADQLRAALMNHPRYEVRLLYIGEKKPRDFDLHAPTVEAAHDIVSALGPVIVVPNYVWKLFFAGFEPNVRSLGMCHSDSDEEYYNPLSWYEPVISKFIAVSPECAERLTRRIPYRAADIATLPYGICVPSSISRPYQTSPLRIVYAGRLTQPQKRVWDFVPLIEELLKERVPFVLDIIGAGDEARPLKEAIRDSFPAGYVRFHARKPHQQMPRVWSCHDVFVQVSDFEGTSVSMLEAMAYGVVPVVTAASSGITGVIHHHQNGFVVPVGDMTTMARLLAKLALDRSLLESMGAAAYQSARAYSMDSYFKHFITILDQVVEAPPAMQPCKQHDHVAGRHPLIRQRQLFLQPQVHISRVRKGKLKRLRERVKRSLRVERMRQLLRYRRANRTDLPALDTAAD